MVQYLEKQSSMLESLRSVRMSFFDKTIQWQWTIFLKNYTYNFRNEANPNMGGSF